ncbi:MAG: hypothetical protein IIA44_09900, partial [Acidobacteria bacterium]|nr:hypothetical protein [Acidobacteriota bacterium]
YDGDYYEPDLQGEPFLDGPPCGGCGHCDDCNPCGPCYMKRWGHCLRCTAARGGFSENLQLITGKQGFKGPVDQGLNGDFGLMYDLDKFAAALEEAFRELLKAARERV